MHMINIAEVHHVHYTRALISSIVSTFAIQRFDI